MKLKRMRRLPGVGRSKGMPVLTGHAPRVAERAPDDLQKLVRMLGGTSQDDKIARRVLKLKIEFPASSLPELVTYDWLTYRHIPFSYQAMLYGGRRAKGGLVPDFVVNYGGRGMAWQVQGEYWHSRTTAHGQKDLSNTLRLLGQVYQGTRIDAVVELWEKDIYRKRPQVFTLGLGGQGLRDT